MTFHALNPTNKSRTFCNISVKDSPAVYDSTHKINCADCVKAIVGILGLFTGIQELQPTTKAEEPCCKTCGMPHTY